MEEACVNDLDEVLKNCLFPRELVKAMEERESRLASGEPSTKELRDKIAELKEIAAKLDQCAPFPAETRKLMRAAAAMLRSLGQEMEKYKMLYERCVEAGIGASNPKEIHG